MKALEEQYCSFIGRKYHGGKDTRMAIVEIKIEGQTPGRERRRYLTLRRRTDGQIEVTLSTDAGTVGQEIVVPASSLIPGQEGTSEGVTPERRKRNRPARRTLTIAPSNVEEELLVTIAPQGDSGAWAIRISRRDWLAALDAIGLGPSARVP